MALEFIRTRDVSLAVHDAGGDGPAVLFVHGLGGSLYSWWAQLTEAAARGYRGIAHDARGAGLSDVPPGPYSVDGWAEDAVAVLDELEVERAALVGHSVGCMVAEQAAVALGERCWALVMVGGALEWPEIARPAFAQRAEAARAGRLHEIAAAVAERGLSEAARRSDPRLHGLILRAVASSDPEGYALSALATADGRMTDLDRLRCPLLATTGSEDLVASPEAAEAIAAAAPDGRVEVLEGAAHWCMLEAPGELNAALFAFLDALATR